MARQRSKAKGVDARFREVLRAFARDPRLAKIAEQFELEQERGGARKFGSNALKLNGKIFAMVVRGRLVVKLAKGRADELVEKALGEFFDPGHGRLMKQWVVLHAERGSWVTLAKEAHDFAAGTG